MKNSTIIAIYIGVILLIAILMPVEIDWSPNYKVDSDLPRGLLVFYEQMESLVNDPIVVNDKPPLEALEEIEDLPKNWLIIRDRFEPTPEVVHEMLDYVRQGNNLFVSTLRSNNPFEDSLGVFYDWTNILSINATLIARDSLKKEFQFIHNVDTIRGYMNRRLPAGIIQILEDSVPLDIMQLGYNKYKNPNLVELRVGDGSVFLHAIPDVFANYTLLYEDSRLYVAHILNLIKDGGILVDQYYQEIDRTQRSPLAIAARIPAFLWFYYVVIGGILFYALFGLKRKAKAIPLIKPVENLSVEFANTISGLYYSKGSWQTMIDMRIQVFQEYLKSQYYLNELKLDKSSQSIIVDRTGLDKKEWENFIHLISSRIDSVEKFKKVNESINDFYKQLKLHNNV